MQTAEEVEKHVPVREGDYGERVATVEPGGVEYIALKERHGKPIELFWTWLSPNLEFATVFVGVIAVAVFGLNLWQAATAIIIGTRARLAHPRRPFVVGPEVRRPDDGREPRSVRLPGQHPARRPERPHRHPSAGSSSTASAAPSRCRRLLPSLSLPFWLAFLVIVVAQVVDRHPRPQPDPRFRALVALPLLGIVFIVACFFIFINGQLRLQRQPPVPGLAGSARLHRGVRLRGRLEPVRGRLHALPAADHEPEDGRVLGRLRSLRLLRRPRAGRRGAGDRRRHQVGPTDIPTAQLQQAMPDSVYYPTLLCIAIGAVAANAINIYSGTMSLVVARHPRDGHDPPAAPRGARRSSSA